MSAYLFLTQLAATLFMTGVIWFVQVVHYPLFAQVGRGNFSIYSQLHATRTGWVVAPVMLIELGTAVLLVFRRLSPPFLSRSAAVAAFALLAVIWLSTFLLQVPSHNRLASGFHAASARRLAKGNWIRTICWTVRSAILLWAILPILQATITSSSRP